MTLSEIVGLGMLIAPFLVLFLWISWIHGPGTAILLYGGTFAIVLWVWVAVWLLTHRP